MPVWLEVILEIVKTTVPALIVFLTVYYLFKGYMENQQKIRMLELNKEDSKEKIKMSFPMRMQAYERLALFCERISLGNILPRVRQENMSAADLRMAIMISIQQEFEYNLAQQVYISEDLWKIVIFAKNDAINVVTLLEQGLTETASSLDLSRAIFSYLNEAQVTPLDKARSAIAQEAAMHLQ